MIVAIAAAVAAVGVILFTLAIRAEDLPEDEQESPAAYAEERRAMIDENLRDLQFEHGLGKLSDADFEAAKAKLEKELTDVLAELEKITGVAPPQSKKAAAAAPAASKAPAAETVCPACGAKFPAPMKFCGECGAPIAVVTR